MSVQNWNGMKLPLVCAAYNFMPNENSRESVFFLMFATDPILLLKTLLESNIRYMGNDANIISLEAMKSIFQLVATNLKNARSHKDPEQFPDITRLQEGDTIMVRNHTAKPFEPKYIGDFRIIKIVGHKVQLQPTQGQPIREEHLDHIKYVLPTDRYISALPDYEQFGRRTNVRLNPDKIPDLQWELTKYYPNRSTSTHTISSIANISHNFMVYGILLPKYLTCYNVISHQFPDFLILLIIAILSGFHPPSMKLLRLT